jgi:hypothetical protein
MKAPAFFLLLLTLIINGCSPVQKTHSWQPGTVQHRNYQKVLVVCILREEDNSIRESIENQLTDELTKNGINAVTSLQLLGSKIFDRMDEEDALYQLNNQCVDAVLVATLLNRQKEKKYTPGIIHYTPYGYSYDRFWRYKTAIKYRIITPEYYSSEKNSFLECNIYAMTTQQLIYSVQSGSTFNWAFETEGNKSFRKIVKGIIKKKILVGVPG